MSSFKRLFFQLPFVIFPGLTAVRRKSKLVALTVMAEDAIKHLQCQVHALSFPFNPVHEADTLD